VDYGIFKNRKLLSQKNRGAVLNRTNTWEPLGDEARDKFWPDGNENYVP